MAEKTPEQARKSEYDKAYYQRRRQYFQDKHKRWKAENKEHVRAYARNYRRENAERLRDASRSAKFKYKYGITLEERDVMFVAQGSKCAACKKPETSHARGWHTDHCHRTGRVRGILCHSCNTSLGQMGEDAAALRALADYIEEHDDVD